MSDDDSDFGTLFENGHWEWSDKTDGLAFISDVAQEAEHVMPIGQKAMAPPDAIQFREDLDVMEQMHFRHKYQRKIKLGEPDVITIQDVKDVVIYTAPLNVMSPVLIKMLHIPTTERFIRALILYCQYYLQVTEIMEERQTQMATKIRTPRCDVIESVYRDNLNDLRLLCAKEYCTIMIGGNDTKMFHHLTMGKSLSDKDAHLIEMLLRICVQIVWLVLGRQYYNKIELEVNRLFKTDIFNRVEHTLRIDYLKNMSPEERTVLLGQCLRRDKKLSTNSPLHNEIFCLRDLDYRLLGLGVVKYVNLPPRLRYLELAIAGPERRLVEEGVALGIVGLPRKRFDAILNPVKMHIESHSENVSLSKRLSGSVRSLKSLKSCDSMALPKKLFADVDLPPRDYHELPVDFPDLPAPPLRISIKQRNLWLERLRRKRRRTWVRTP